MPKICCWYGTILFLSLLMWPSLTARLAIAQAAGLAQSSGDVFPDDTAPNMVRWELRTATDQAVVWEYTFPTVNSFQNWTISKEVFADTAASVNLDWAAWSAAVVNPAYNRWLIARNGVTVEKPWPGSTVGLTPNFVMDELELTITKNTTNGHGNIGFGSGALDHPPVPEPSTWLLFVGGLIQAGMRRHRHCR